MKHYLIKLERYQGPFIRDGKNPMNAVLELFNEMGIFYLNNRFEVKEIG